MRQNQTGNKQQASNCEREMNDRQRENEHTVFVFMFKERTHAGFVQQYNVWMLYIKLHVFTFE